MSIPVTPTVAELVATAIAYADLAALISPNATRREMIVAAISVSSQAAELWGEAHGHPVGATVNDAGQAVVAMALVAYADGLNRQAADDEADELADGIESGDLDRDGRAIPYDLCMSA